MVMYSNSNNLEKLLRIEVDLSLLTEALLPLSKTGRTAAYFHEVGKYC